MKLWRNIKQLLLKCDLFKTTEYFRYKGQPQYRTLTGSICSIILIIVFIIIFSSSILSTLNKNKLSWGYNLIQNTTDSLLVKCTTKEETKFMFAVGIDQIDMNQGERYFDIKLESVNVVDGVTEEIEVMLQPCDWGTWDGANEEIQEIFQRRNFSTLLCPAENSTFNITGSRSNKQFRYIRISALKCNPNSTHSSLPCASNSTIDTFLLSHPNFYLHFYFVNGLLNPTQSQQITYYLQDRNVVPFNTMYGGQSNIYMSRYEVTTDQSIMPYEEPRVNQGGIVNYVGPYLAARVFRDRYATVNIRKSHVSWEITRNYTKIDSTLSYIGGLFGFIMVAFVFLSIYTEYSYEVQMGDKLYFYDHHTPLNSGKFHFFTFIGYLFYCIFQFFGCCKEWETMKKFDACRDQIKKQFDISFLMKRIIFFERSLRILFQDHQFKGLHMHQKLTLKEAQELRSYYRLRDKIKGNMEERREMNPLEQHSEFTETNKSSDSNYVEDMIQGNNVFSVESGEKQLNKVQKKRSLKGIIGKTNNKVHPIIEMPQKSQQDSNSSEVVLINPNVTQSITQSPIQNSSKLMKRDSELKSKLKILRKQSQSGNKLSRKIFQGVNSQLVKNILLRIEQNANLAKNESNQILICEHDQEFQIRISKRRDSIRRDSIQKPNRKEEDKDFKEEKIQIQMPDSSSEDEKKEKPDDFDYIE